MGHQFRSKEKLLHVGEIKGSNKALSSEFDVAKYPAAIMLCGNINKKENGLVYEKLEKCKKLEKIFLAKEKKAKAALDGLKKLSESELLKKKLSELRSISKTLGIDTSAFLEKSTFVQEIVKYFERHDGQDL